MIPPTKMKHVVRGRSKVIPMRVDGLALAQVSAGVKDVWVRVHVCVEPAVVAGKCHV